MASYVKINQITDIPSGGIRSVFVAGRRIALANIDGEFFAIDDSCTHAGCSLGSEGMLEDHAVVCGCHGAKFDLTSGKVLGPPAVVDVKSYETKVENGVLYIKI